MAREAAAEGGGGMTSTAQLIPGINAPLQARILDVSEEAYHGDPLPEPSLSATIAKIIMDRSPLHAWQEHPRLGEWKRADKKEFDRGALFHKLILGKGAEIASVDARDWKTKAARDARDQARAEGKIPVLAQDLFEAKLGIGTIRERLDRVNIRLDGESEVAIAWQELSYEGPIWCRGKLDHLKKGARNATIVDLKTARSAHPAACLRHIVSYGYDIQQAAYTRAVETLYPENSGRVDFIFLFVETEPPFAILPARIDGILRERGERRWRGAVEAWAHCRATNDWPSYARGITTLEAPAWLLSGMEGRDDEG